MPDDGNKRIGTVMVATATLENAQSRAFLRETLFARFCPFFVSVSPNGSLRAFTGFCDDFEPVPEGEKAPQYVMSVAQDTTGQRTVAFRQVEKEPPKAERRAGAKPPARRRAPAKAKRGRT